MTTTDLEPAAWMYLHEFSTGTQHRVVCPQTERMEDPESRGWTETALYTADQIKALIEERDRLREDVAQKRHAIDRDRYIVAAYLQDIRKAINGHRWLLEGRGPYEWDDDRYREEFSDWLNSVEQATEYLASLAWDKSNSETEYERVLAAKAAAQAFLNKPKPSQKRVALPSDLGLPCPTCKQMPRNARAALAGEKP